MTKPVLSIQQQRSFDQSDSSATGGDFPESICQLVKHKSLATWKRLVYQYAEFIFFNVRGVAIDRSRSIFIPTIWLPFLSSDENGLINHSDNGLG